MQEFCSIDAYSNVDSFQKQQLSVQILFVLCQLRIYMFETELKNDSCCGDGAEAPEPDRDVSHRRLDIQNFLKLTHVVEPFPDLIPIDFAPDFLH